jgi:hypothetical protein
MIGRKLALLAASLAGGAVVTWTIVETLRDGVVEPRTTTDAEADSPIARLVARMGPPDQGAAFAASEEGPGWRAWNRSGAELAAGDATGADSGFLGDRNGHDFWNAWARGLDRARGVAWAAMRNPDGMPGAAHREPVVPGRQRYHLPQGGQRTILTSGHRLGEQGIRLPRNMDVALARYGRQPVRVEVCVNRAGKPQEARVVDGTGVNKVDNYIARQMLEGRYRRLWQNGRPVAFCERTTVVIGS